jgi:hypothetical protein
MLPRKYQRHSLLLCGAIAFMIDTPKPLSNSPEPENVSVELSAKESVFAVAESAVDWYSILAVPLTERSPAIAYDVEANVPANAVKPIFLSLSFDLLFVRFVITNRVFLTKKLYFSLINLLIYD